MKKNFIEKDDNVKCSPTYLFLNHCIYLFVFGCAGSSLLHTGFSLDAATARPLLAAALTRLSAAAPLSVEQSTGPRAQAQQLRRMGLVVPQHVALSQIRDQTGVSSTGSGFFTTEPPGKP